MTREKLFYLAMAAVLIGATLTAIAPRLNERAGDLGNWVASSD